MYKLKILVAVVLVLLLLVFLVPFTPVEVGRCFVNGKEVSWSNGWNPCGGDFIRKDENQSLLRIFKQNHYNKNIFE
ncbi:MAG: hypothetical protein ACI88L_000654 [Candidatus Paceibacteria bacterium]|jgi:hypothetical protein